MKRCLTLLALGLCLLSVITVPAFAADQQVKKAHLKHSKHSKKTPRAKQNTRAGGPLPSPTDWHAAAAANDYAAINVPVTGLDYLPIDLQVPGQSFVSSGPYIGIPLSFSGNNLIINSPNINEDVTLLNMRKNIRERLIALGRFDETERAHILLSGIVEAQANYQNPGTGSNSSDIDLTGAGLDAYILGPSNWTSGLLSLKYDNNIGAQTGSLSTNFRPIDSRVFVDKAFIVIGDFSRSPFYGSGGQMYVPFGVYASNMISSPLTKILARTKERAIAVGYRGQEKDAFYATGYVFRGDTFLGSTGQIANGGVNVGYHFVCGKFSGDFGGGAIGNIADSIGMQITGGRAANVFDGFGGTTVITTNPVTGLLQQTSVGNEHIVHRVPAYNVRGLFSIGETIDLLAEYVGASTSFNPNDLTFNSHGAKPYALNAEAAYTIPIFSKPTSFALGYGKAKDTLALGIPRQRCSFAINTSIWRDTLQSFEFRHDINYAAKDSATGSNVLPLITGTGKPDNLVTAQFDLYF